MIKFSKYILLLLPLLLTTGCTEENLKDCFSGIHLRFRFTLHEEPEKGNLFGRDIRHVRVYIFDKDSVLQQITTGAGTTLTNDYVMQLNLKPGQYTIVAWASDNQDFFRSHNQRQTIRSSESTFVDKELEIGVSRMEDLRILLQTLPAQNYPEDVKPANDNFDDLFFGAAGKRSLDGKSQYSFIPVDVQYGRMEEREIELIRNTNIVRITIEGIEHLSQDGAVIHSPEKLFDIWATGANVRYLYNNAICSQTPSVRYFPQYSFPKVNTLRADIKTERLEWTKMSGQRLELQARLKNGQTLYAGELLSLLKEAKDANGNYIYKNQEDLDRIYIHPIRFVIGQDNVSQDLYVKIFIHQWELVTLIPEI